MVGNMKKFWENEKKSYEQSRNWFFTDYELIDMKMIYNKWKDIIRAIGWGDEIGPKNGKRHYQGHIQFVNKKRYNGVKKVFGSHCIHVETCRGSLKQNEVYCSKDGKYQIVGRFIQQGVRTDLEDIKLMMDNGATMDEIAIKYHSQFVQYGNGLRQYKKLCDQRRSKAFRKLEVELVCGPTNTNKTRNALEKYPDAFKITGTQLKWWDGYAGEDKLLIDEYNNDVGITSMLNYLDGYQLRLDIKGSFTYAMWTKVIITTNLHPDEIHSQAKPEHLKALFRRITKITNKYEYEPGDWCAEEPLR